MSNIRRTHPGYYRVTMAYALLWYCGLGVTFLLLPERDTLIGTYDVITALLPVWEWGVLYITIGVTLAVTASIPTVPHSYVRACLSLGFVLGVFWVIALLIAAFDGQTGAFTRLPAWTTLSVIGYAALIEPERS